MAINANPSFGPEVRTSKGTLIFGTRLENRTSRFAEYTVTVSVEVANDGTREYVVEKAYGKIGAKQQIREHPVTGGGGKSDRDAAISFAKQLVQEKRSGDYNVVTTVQNDDDDELANASGYQSFPFSNIATDDDIVPPPRPPKDEEAACSCQPETVEMAHKWSEPEPAEAAVAEYLTQEGYEMLRFSNGEPRRWLVSSKGSCSSGYTHARAVKLTEQDDSPGPSAEYVRDLIVESLAKDARNDTLDFAMVIDEDSKDFYVVDALRWSGKDLSSEPWLSRRHALEANFVNIFPSTSKSRQIKLAPRVAHRIRETYLVESDKFRFELYSESGLLGADAWALP